MGSKQRKEATRAARASAKATRQKRLIKKTVLLKEKKSWHPILAPDIFGKAQIGESLVDDAQTLLGKTVSLSLMTLTGDMKKQNITVEFVVDTVANNRGITTVAGYHIVPASIKRMVRRGKTRVDASIICACKDGVHLRIKPFVLTATVANRATAAQIRNHIVTFIATYLSHHDHTSVFRDIVSEKLQNYMHFVARKVFPVRSCGIRAVEVVKDAEVTALPQKEFDIETLIKTADATPKPQFKRVLRPRFPRKTFTSTRKGRKVKRR